MASNINILDVDDELEEAEEVEEGRWPAGMSHRVWAEEAVSLPPDYSGMVRVVEEGIAYLFESPVERRVARLESEVGSLRARVRFLEAQAEERVSFVGDGPVRWLEQNGDKLLEFRGQQIAVTATGVIATAADLDELRVKVEALGIEDEVLFSSVPASFVT